MTRLNIAPQRQQTTLTSTPLSWLRRGMKASLLGGALLTLLSGLPVAAADSAAVGTPLTHVLATEWGMTLKSDGSGFYNDLARFTILKADMGANYDIQPYRRAKAHFFADPASCLYPTNLNVLLNSREIEKTDGLIESAPILRVRVYIFSRPGTKPPASVADLDNKVMAYALGSRAPYVLRKSHADFIAVADEVSKAQMLLSGRVDLIGAAMPDLLFVMKRLGAPLPPYDPAFIINDTAIRVVCHDTPDTRAFIDKLNAHMKGIHGRGDLSAFLQRQGLNPDQYLPKSNLD